MHTEQGLCTRLPTTDEDDLKLLKYDDRRVKLSVLQQFQHSVEMAYFIIW